jgi:hypothetical protein
MVDALFWYTGLIAWILIVFGVVSTLLVEAHRSESIGPRRAFESTLSLAASLPITRHALVVIKPAILLSRPGLLTKASA